EADSQTLYLTRGLDECLFVFPEKEWRQQESKFKAMSFTKKEYRKFQRIFFAGASQASPDKQWRILVPDYLKEYGGLSKEIMVVGVSNRIEIWDKQKWMDFYKNSKENYEQIAENLMDF
ncbi:MAG TPA: division/cell wall cluster transcriptional repressor MraZ, partial [Candidatus Omnitrophota bacterium]|nr:division/cell wall cluster transcriptional repressor MraZ [Candidatus Omnitrophota bacterium]